MKNIKYSFLMPYLNRAKQFKNTINCFRYFYGNRSDWEIVLIEDGKNIKDTKKHLDLMNLLEETKDFKITHLQYLRTDCYNPCEMFNIAAKNAKGEFLIITNPEILHENNLLSGFDVKMRNNPNRYIVCCCKAIVNVNDFIDFKDLKYDMNPDVPWYIHPIHCNRHLHFCSMISKKMYESIGGFDEGYVYGTSREDTDFAMMVKAKGINIDVPTNLVVMHQQHDREYGLSKEKRRERAVKNANYFNRKWKG